MFLNVFCFCVCLCNELGYGYRVLAANPMVYGIGSMVATMGCIMLTMGLSYDQNPLGKHLAWTLTSGMVGFSLLGLSTIAGGAIVQQAALITGCIVGGMSLTAMAAPGDSFLKMGPYLGVGLGVVIAASLGMFVFSGVLWFVFLFLFLIFVCVCEIIIYRRNVLSTFNIINEC